MSEIKKDGFVGYDYKQLTVSREEASLYLDGYKSFGWETDDNFTIPPGGETVLLYLRRDRKILNKMELTRLQRNFEASMAEIRALKESATAKPLWAALAVGIAGTAFMAGSVFAITAEPPVIWLCALLGIPGCIGWALPYFLYRRGSKKRTAALQPLIEAKYDELYGLCKKGAGLL